MTGKPVGPPLQHSSAVVWVTFSPHGKRVATGSDDNTGRIWSATTGQLLAPPLRHHGTVLRVIFHPDGKLVLTASDDETVRVWDAETAEPITPPLQIRCIARDAAFNREGCTVYMEGAAGGQVIWPVRREDRPVAELVRLAELLSASRIDPERGYLPLEAEQLRRLWQK